MASISIQFPHRISLSQASKISGYHQDYLSQLCRIGKIKAQKIGRNWYTTQDELTNLVNPMEFDVAEFAVKNFAPEPEMEVEEVYYSAAPALEEQITISRVNELPIAMTQVKPAANRHHNLHSLINRVKLQELQTEIKTLAKSLQAIDANVQQQNQEIQKIKQNRIPTLQTMHSPSLVFFNQPKVQEKIDINTNQKPKPVSQNNETQKSWFWPFGVVSISFSLVVMVLISFGHNSNPTTSIFYQPTGQVQGATDKQINVISNTDDEQLQNSSTDFSPRD